MSIRTSEGREPRAALRWTAGLALPLLLCVLSACEDDVGRCCTVLEPSLVDRIPTATSATGGQPTSDIALDPAFDCDELLCVAYRGSRAFCTARCIDDDDCPDDFRCDTVLEADPGPDASIRPTDRFCVRENHVCSE